MSSNNVTPYCYKKKFIARNGAIFLVNDEPAGKYIDEKVRELVFAKSPDELANVKRTILREFNEIYEYDLETADCPEPQGVFKDEEEKNRFIEKNILIADFHLYLGNIFCNYHTNLIQAKKIPILECKRLVIDYNELYHRAAGEYIATLSGIPYPFQICDSGTAAQEIIYKPNHACGTTFILPALIEHFLLTELQNKMLFAGLDEVRKLIKSGGIALEADEKRLVNAFLSYKENGAEVHEGKKEDAMKRLYRIFVKYGIIDDSMDNHKILTGTKIKTKTTLGSLLHSGYAEAQIRPEYFKLITILFDSKKMNIRNCVTHGKSTIYDYLAIEIAAVMMQLLWDIDNGSIFA